MGFLSNGQFHLVVSLRYVPVAGEIAFWCDLFNQTSRIIHDTTDGVLSIGSVLISANSMGGRDADVWVHPAASVWSNSTGARLWFPTEALDVPQDHMMHPTILAHELAHYLYDLRDEYNNGSTCQGNIATQASLMEGYAWTVNTRWTDSAGVDYPNWTTFFADYTAGTAVLQIGTLTEFCHAGNHNATANNNQNNVNGNQSCWTYMAGDANHNNIPYGLVEPGTGGPALAAPAFPAAPACTELIPVQRFMLVLDRSGSMMGSKVDQLKVGANFWVDFVNEAEELGLVTYAGSETLEFAMSAVPAAGASAWRTARHTVVDNISAGGSTAIGDALRAGLDEIVANGRASSQVMLLFTDGLQNAGTETAEDVLPALRAAGVRVYTVGLGNDQDAVLLGNIAATTGATYFPIDGDLTPTEAATAITEALVQIAGESRENGGIVSYNPVDGAFPPAGAGDDALPLDWTYGEPGRRPKPRPRRSFSFPVTITPGSQHCTLGALWMNPSRQFTVKVFNPSGAAVAPGGGVRRVSGTYPYSFYEIDNPSPGVWKVEVSGAHLTTTRFRTVGFEVNDQISFDVSVVHPHIKLGTSIEIRARLRAPFAVPRAKVRAQILTPSGKWLTVKFKEHKGAIGDPNEPFTYTARIPTLRQKPGQYLIVVDAQTSKNQFTVELDEFYRQRPQLKPEDHKRSLKVPPIKRRAFTAVIVDREGPTKSEPLVGYNPKPSWVPRNQGSLLKTRSSRHRTR